MSYTTHADAEAAIHALENKYPYQFRPESYGALRDSSHDDTSAIQQAIQAAFDYANNSGTYYAEVVFSPGTYLVAGAFTETYSGNSQIGIPIQPQTSNKITLVLRGPLDASALPMWNASAPQRSGAVLRSTAADPGTVSTAGTPCVLGGPNWKHGYADFNNGNQWNNVLLSMDGISVVVPNPAPFAGMDFSGLAQFRMDTGSVFADGTPKDFTAGAPADPTDYVKPTNTYAYGLLPPMNFNNDNTWIGNFSCEGMYVGLHLTEHATVENCRLVYCCVGVQVQATAHFGYIQHASIEWCVTSIDYNAGRAIIVMADIEQGSDVWAPYAIVRNTNNANGLVQLVSNYCDSSTDYTWDPHFLPGPTSNAGDIVGLGLQIKDCRWNAGAVPTANVPAIAASGTAVFNPFWADAQVTISGGTVTGITIDGKSTGLTGQACVIVPAGRTITLTYTGTPTWSWYRLS